MRCGWLAGVLWLTPAMALAQVGSGASLPVNCNTGGGSLFYLTAGDSGLYVCANDVWTKQIGPGGGGAAWGGITGTLSAQTDLQTALDGKQIAGSYLAPSGNGGSLTGLTKAQVGLGNVDNTSDLSKPISTVTQTALDARLLTNANAVSATKLLTPRTINGVAFDGTANITLPAASSVVTVADTTNATTAYANITGLSFAVSAATRYRVSCVLPYDANAITTGIGIGWTGPASPTLTRGVMLSPITTATPGSTVSVGNDTGAVTTASVATTNNIATFEGIWSNGANAGTVQMRVKSEVAIANAIIVRTGAMCSYAVY